MGQETKIAIGRDIGDDTYIVLARVSEVITGVGTPEANANLMAAAPDLSKALASMLSVCWTETETLFALTATATPEISEQARTRTERIGQAFEFARSVLIQAHGLERPVV